MALELIVIIHDKQRIKLGCIGTTRRSLIFHVCEVMGQFCCFLPHCARNFRVFIGTAHLFYLKL